MNGIFSKLTAIFAETAPQETPAHDSASVALAALMVRLARADGVYDAEERTAIEVALSARFNDAAGLLAAGEAAEAGALDHHQFTKLVKRAYDPEERGALLEDLWSVVLADNMRDAEENALMRQFASLLYVPEREVAAARQRVQARQ